MLTILLTFKWNLIASQNTGPLKINPITIFSLQFLCFPGPCILTGSSYPCTLHCSVNYWLYEACIIANSQWKAIECISAFKLSLLWANIFIFIEIWGRTTAEIQMDLNHPGVLPLTQTSVLVIAPRFLNVTCQMNKVTEGRVITWF